MAPLVGAEYQARGERRVVNARWVGATSRHRFGSGLLVALTHLRQGTSVRASARIFGIHQRSVRRYRDEICRLLAAHVNRRGLRGRSAVMVDGTEVPRSMPIDRNAQRAAWSGKTKDRVVKGPVVADASRGPVWFEANPSGEGRTHDVTILRTQVGLFAALTLVRANVLVDKAYQGLWRELGDRVVVPRLTKRGATKAAA